MFDKIMQNPGRIWDSDTEEMVNKRGVKWKEVYTFQEVEELVLWAKYSKQWLGVSYQDGAFVLYNSPHVVYALFLGEVKVLRTYGSGRVPQMIWDGMTLSSVIDYMGMYDVPHNYLTRARLLTKLHEFDNETAESPTLPVNFEWEKVLSLEPWTNHFKKPSVVLKYKGLPPLFGLTQIRRSFVSITNRTLVRLYQKYEVPLPYALRGKVI